MVILVLNIVIRLVRTQACVANVYAPSRWRGVVIDADYWREQVTKFRARAMTTKDDTLQAELLELAQVRDELAEKIEVTAPSR